MQGRLLIYITVLSVKVKKYHTTPFGVSADVVQRNPSLAFTEESTARNAATVSESDSRALRACDNVTLSHSTYRESPDY